MCLINILGKAKHVSVHHLWTQDACKSEKFVTKKVCSSVNPADLMTKPLPRLQIEQLMKLVKIRDGTDSVHSRIQSVSGTVRHLPQEKC